MIQYSQQPNAVGDLRKEKILFDSNGEPLFGNSFERIILNDEEKAEITAAYKTLDKYEIAYSVSPEDSVISRLNSKTDSLAKIRQVGEFGSAIGFIWACAALYYLLWEQNINSAAWFIALCAVDFGVIFKTIMANESK